MFQMILSMKSQLENAIKITELCQPVRSHKSVWFMLAPRDSYINYPIKSKAVPSPHHFPNQTEWVLVSRTTNHRPPSPGAVLVFSPPMKSLQIRLVVEWQLCAMLWVGVFQHGLLSLYSISFLSKTNCILEICFIAVFVEHQNSGSQPIKLSLVEPGDS